MTVFTISGHNINYFFPKENKTTTIQYLERWTIGDKEISFQRKEDALFYELLDKSTGKVIKGSIDSEEHQIEDIISYLIECQPQISEMGEVTFSPRMPPPYILRWMIGNVEICLYRKEDQLSYVVLDPEKDQSIQGSIDLDNHDPDQVLAYLQECQPVINSNGEVSFSPKLHSDFKWVFRNKEVRLLKEKDKGFDRYILWELFDKSTKTFSQVSFLNGYLFWDKLSNYSFSKPGRLSMTHYDDLRGRVSSDAFKDCEIKKLKLTSATGSPTHRLLAVYLEKIVGRSELDASVPIDNHRWAVTLINSGRSQALNPLTWAGHAAIIIEGRENGTFFKLKAHLKKVEGVLLQNVDTPIFYSQKAKTWPIDSETVRQMLDSINWEIKKQAKGKPQVFFDIRGAESKLVKPVAIKKYDSYLDLIKKTINTDLYFGGDIPLNRFYKRITLQDRSGKQWIEGNTKAWLRWKLRDPSPRQIFIQSQSDNSWTEVRVPDNCLTWAKAKLECCGIYFKDNPLDTIYASPKRYMDEKLGQQDDIKHRNEKYLHPEYRDDEMSLTHAIREGNIPIVKFLLSKNIDLQLKNNRGENALHVACQEKDLRVINLLLEKGINVNELTAYGISPLFFAFAYNDQNLAEPLLKWGANVNQKDLKGHSLLHYEASVTDREKRPLNVKMLELFLKYKVDLNIKNNLGETPLITAVKSSDLPMVRWLLQNSAAVDEENINGQTALWYACSNYNFKSEEIVRLLIEHDVNLIAANRKIGLSANPFKVVRDYNRQKLDIMMSRALFEQEKKAEQKEKQKIKGNATCLVS